MHLRLNSEEKENKKHLHELLHQITVVYNTRLYIVNCKPIYIISHLWNVDYLNRTDRVVVNREYTEHRWLGCQLVDTLNYFIYIIKYKFLLAECVFCMFYIVLNMQPNTEMTANPKKIFFNCSVSIQQHRDRKLNKQTNERKNEERKKISTKLFHH